VVVVGAGISGLTAAYLVARDHRDAEVIVLEQAGRVGGKIETTTFAGLDVDCAADAFLARVPEAVDLCTEVGLADELVTPASRTALLYTGGRLRPFPEGLSLGVPTDLDALRASDVVSAAAVERVAAEPTMPAALPAGDLSVGELVRGRVGDEVFETLVAPLLSGVYAGDADRLSAAVATPQFLAAVREHGSLVAGLRAQMAAAASSDTPVFFGLRHGTQTLTDRLAHRVGELGGAVRTRSCVRGIHREDDATVVTTDDGSEVRAAAVVLATPDFATADLVRAVVPDVADELGEVPYASVTLVALACAPDDLAQPLDGTGFLVPEREGLLLTACSWASSKWAHLSRDRCILRASVGRLGDERPDALSDAAVVEAVRRDLETTMGLRGVPSATRVSRWPRALPQFAPGHLDRVALWGDRVDEHLPGVVLAGAGIGGLGIPACIRRAGAAVDALAASGRLG